MEGEARNNWILSFFEIASIFEFILTLIVAFFVTILFVIASKVFANVVKNRVIQNTISDDDVYSQRVGTLVSSMVFYPLLLISFFIGFQIIGFDIWLLLWWISVGLWFAFREVLWNMLAGVMILLTKEIKLWDNIEIEKSADKGYFGTIEEITLRYTVLRTIEEKRRVIIPNLDMINYPIKTYNTEDYIKMYSFVVLSYSEDIDKCIKIIKEAVNSCDLITNKSETNAVISKIWDSGWDRKNTLNTSNWIEIRVVFHYNPNKVPHQNPSVILWIVNQYIYKAIVDNNIQIAYPHSAITVDKNDKNLLSSALYLMKNKK